MIKEGGSTPRRLLLRTFSSFEELADMAVAWDIDFHQISKNYSSTIVNQIQAGNLLYSHLSCGCFVTHAGSTPEDMYTISLIDASALEFNFYNRLFDRPVLILSYPGQEFRLVSRPGFKSVNFSIPFTILDEYCENNFGYAADKILGGLDRVVSIDPETGTNLKGLAQQLSTQARLSRHLAGVFNPAQSFETTVLECLFDGLHLEKKKREEECAAEKNQLVKRTLEYIGDHEHAPLSVTELSTAVNTSERTLRRLFHRQLGTSPKKYLLGQRMYGAHRQLWQSDPSRTHVTDVANEWGFWHLGQFAKDYREIFGELPSETLNRSV